MDEKAFVPFDYLWRAYGGVGRLAWAGKLSRKAGARLETKQEGCVGLEVQWKPSWEPSYHLFG